MIRKAVWLSSLIVVGLLFKAVLFHRLLGPASAGLGPEKSGSAAVREKERGVSWVAGRPVGPEQLVSLLDNHVNWIVQTPFGWQRDVDSPEIRMATGGRVLWGESDEGLEETTRLAKTAGIKVMLKPHIWLTRAGEGKWRAQIEMKNEEDWRQWFGQYRLFMLHYARLAERCGIEALCIGTELHQAAVLRESDWRSLIADIRSEYKGRLTYAANWYREFEEVRFWDDLDVIGIQAYFPLANQASPSLETLKAGWQPHVAAIEKVRSRFDKQIVFTEIGYRAMPDSAIEPWLWPERTREPAEEAGLRNQAVCFEAFFQTFWHRDWFAGAYMWKWFPHYSPDRYGQSRGFSPQGKPAETVMRRWYAEHP